MGRPKKQLKKRKVAFGEIQEKAYERLNAFKIVCACVYEFARVSLRV